jgi:hypothetical protein
MGQLDRSAEVDTRSGVTLDQPGERPAEQVVTLELHIGERNHLRQEAVDPHEPGKDVAELLLAVLVERSETVDRRLEAGVDAFVVLVRVVIDRIFQLSV